LAKAHFLGITLNATGNTKAVLFKAACSDLGAIPVLGQSWPNHMFPELLPTPLEAQKRFYSKLLCPDLEVVPLWASLDQTTCFWNYFKRHWKHKNGSVQSCFALTVK